MVIMAAYDVEHLYPLCQKRRAVLYRYAIM
jgi:hypothetical protein